MQDATVGTPKKRGRPTTGRARTPAQRSADLRARARTQICEGSGPLGALADTVLLEGLSAAYRARRPFEVERIAVELLGRLASYLSVTVTQNEPVKATCVVAVTENKPVKATGGVVDRAYPLDVKFLAVEMADCGETSASIRAAIKDACGRTLDPFNFSKTIRRWRAALAGT